MLGLLAWEALLGVICAVFLIRRDARKLERRLKRRDR